MRNALRRWVREHRGATAGIGVAALALAAFAVFWFGPQYLFIDRSVNEALPSSAPRSEAGDSGAPLVAEPRVVAEGEFLSLEHGASGTAQIVELSDGSRFLRLENLSTSNGPDLRVIITDRPVSEDWDVWDDGEYVDLGALKGNIGSSNYEIPAALDLVTFKTAVVWCRRFTVGFGVAPLTPQ